MLAKVKYLTPLLGVNKCQNSFKSRNFHLRRLCLWLEFYRSDFEARRHFSRSVLWRGQRRQFRILQTNFKRWQVRFDRQKLFSENTVVTLNEGTSEKGFSLFWHEIEVSTFPYLNSNFSWVNLSLTQFFVKFCKDLPIFRGGTIQTSFLQFQL